MPIPLLYEVHLNARLCVRAQYALKVERGLEAKTVRAEAKVLRALQASPHVVRLLEQGAVNERSFMVMEVRPGQDPSKPLPDVLSME